MTPTESHPPSRHVWRISDDLVPHKPIRFVYRGERIVARIDGNSPEDAQALAERFVALAGVDDPASALKAAREALEWAVDFVPPHEQETRRAVNAALRLLTPKLGAE